MPVWTEAQRENTKENAMKTWPEWMQKAAGMEVEVYKINHQLCIYFCYGDGDIRLMAKSNRGQIEEFLLAPCDIHTLAEAVGKLDKDSINIVRKRVETQFPIK